MYYNRFDELNDNSLFQIKGGSSFWYRLAAVLGGTLMITGGVAIIFISASTLNLLGWAEGVGLIISGAEIIRYGY
ncbi:hypothetical protein [uncultured Clostridium sp.]|uniref:hypothetical protein n=1 Tax=uncultured Clostridium sp. TaxID=59620 RepID=UPI0025E2A4FB|nr:hypothetical protein [uncultured Clostridium sp.]